MPEKSEKRNGRARTSKATLAELFLDAVLLLGFIAQAFLIGCLTTIGHIPIPAKWAKQQLNQQLPADLHLHAEGFHFTLDGQIVLKDLSMRTKAFETPLFRADRAFVSLNLRALLRLQVQLDDIVLANGSLTLPAVYAPSGMDTQILERIALKLTPESGQLNVDSFAALHEDIRLRGNLVWPLDEAGEDDEARDLQAKIHRLLEHVSSAIRHKARIEGLLQPTVFFQITRNQDGALDIQSSISSRHLEMPKLEATDLSMEAELTLEADRLVSKSSILFHAEQIDLPEFQTTVRNANARVKREAWDELLAGEFPEMEITAKSIDVEHIQLKASRLSIWPETFPLVSFDGSTKGIDGAVEVVGKVNTKTRDATIDASGQIDLLPIAPESIRSKLPKLEFGEVPFYRLSMDFAKDFTLQSAELHAEMDNLSIEGISFDHIRARGSFADGVLSIPNIYIRRDWQWIDVGFNLNSESLDYKVSLYGFAKPYDYNDMLPRWWGPIFKDFDFEQADDGLGDFIIYGNTKQRAADLFFGHVRASNVSYKGVRVDEGTLFVRGRGPYAEIHALDATSGDGWVKGDIRFASRLDHVRGPMSVRLDLDTVLPLRDAQKLFDGDIGEVIADFETAALPHTKLKGAIFNQEYPEFAGKSFVDLTAVCPFPIKFRGIPLDFLQFDLFGRTDITYLRDIQIGYAGGRGQIIADVITEGDAPVVTRFDFHLEDADQALAIANLDALKGEDSESREEAPPGAGTGKLSLKLQAKGPVEHPFMFAGLGSLRIDNEELSSIQLFGPLSRQLQNTRFGFTSFSLHTLETDFRLEQDQAHLSRLEINGPRTNIQATGSMNLRDQSLDLRVSVFLFANAGDPDSNLRKIGEMITRPIPNLLEFELTGTADEQKWRSLYDPRKLIPQF
jgi:hypothetical protein